MRLFALNVGEEVVDMANFDPLGRDVGTKVLTPYFLYLIEHPAGRVLFDTGANARYITASGDASDQGHEARIVMRPGQDVSGALARLGLRPTDIRHVALSHLHVDHAGGVGLFPHARLYVQRVERTFARCPPVYQRRFYIAQDFARPADWLELDGEHDVFGDGRIVLFATPGHSAGHQSMLVCLDGGAVILVGDAAYSPRNLHERILPAILWSPDEMVRSWELLERLRDRHDARLVFTHDLDWRTSTRVGPAEWYE